MVAMLGTWPGTKTLVWGRDWERIGAMLEGVHRNVTGQKDVSVYSSGDMMSDCIADRIVSERKGVRRTTCRLP